MERTIVSALKLEDGTLVCKTKRGRSYKVFKKQGDLDGACATYCVIMNLLILGVIKDKDTEWNAMYKDSATKRLFREFCEKYGMHRGGKTYYKIKRMLDASFIDKVKTLHRNTYDESSVNLITETILKRDIPVIMSIRNHALLAVGIEQEEGVTTKILCLDPSGDYMENTSRRWNAEIQIQDGATCQKFLYTRRHMGKFLEPKKERIEDLLIITKNV